MHGQYPPYPPLPPPGPPYGPPPPPRRDRANLVPLFVLLGVLAVALLGTLTFVVVKVAGSEGGEPLQAVEATPSAVSPRAVTGNFAGTWKGEGYYHNKKGEKRNFTANITLTEGSDTGRASYTGFDCSGTLRVESVSSDKIVMYERIIQGNEPGGNCASASTGYVTLTVRADGGVLYSWYSTRAKLDASNPASQATLSREQTGT
jgi:hypothetical protein